MKIQVTQQHINSGSQGSCTNDPIALALKDSGFCEVWVSPAQLRVRITRDGPMIDHPMPEEVLAFMYNFDNGRPQCAAPFEFELEEK